MKIEELLMSNSNINLTITLEDLRTLTSELIEKTKEELEESVKAEKEETYPTRKEVCQLLKVNQSTLWRWAKRGYLTPIEIGGKLHYKMSDIKHILNGGE